jgi:RNA polymerase sigma-70 factor (sigma-E family)
LLRGIQENGDDVSRTPPDFVEFATERGPHLYRAACVLTGNRHEAEDLAQEALAKVYRSWHKIRDMQAPAAYAHTVLVRTFLSQRRLRRFKEQPADWIDTAPTHVTTEAAGEDTALRVALLEALARLSPQDRAVLVLRYWEDQSVEETARRMTSSPESVRTRSHRALTRLRNLLGDQVYDLTSS